LTLTAPQFEALLKVQDLDTALDQHRHRRRTLPERDEVGRLDTERVTLAAQVSTAAVGRDEVAGRQEALEHDLNATEARIAEINRRLYGGMVSATRELQAMAEEVEHLQSRRSALEDRILEVMEVREPLDAEVAALERRAEQLSADRTGAAARLASAEETADAEIEVLADERDQAVSTVPPDLLRTYESLRARLDGVGAARLVGSSCAGCHLALPATELDRIKRSPADAMVFCDQCGRILVRS
jgi:predicted  nucleic acid-binding Zn-ribbon protein